MLFANFFYSTFNNVAIGIVFDMKAMIWFLYKSETNPIVLDFLMISPIMLVVLLLNNLHENTVMGIKGRRVHMIEELSQTIISFQRGKKQMNDPPVACHSILCSLHRKNNINRSNGSLLSYKNIYLILPYIIEHWVW